MSAVMDPVKADLAWRQHVGTEMRTFRSPMQRPQSAPRLRNPRPRPSSASDRQPKAHDGRLRLGDAVTIAGMQRRRDLNGTTAEIVQSTPDAVGRVQVRLTTPGSEKMMRVRADRLMVEGGSLARMARPASAGALGRSAALENLASHIKRSAGGSRLSTPVASGHATPLLSTSPNARGNRKAGGDFYRECFDL